jgi:nucleotide-binding universal stress UspA family protein
MKPVRRILFATDFSTASRRALDVAVAMAKSLKAKLVIVSVVAPLVTVPNEYIDARTLDRISADAVAWSTQQLGRLRAKATKARVKASIVLREGDPAEQIVRTSRATKSDLIVVGTHGRHGLPKLLLGSVAQRVLSRATCPVLTVRGH